MEMIAAIELIRGIRPAPLAALAAAVCGLSRRRWVRHAQGSFNISPTSPFGAALLTGEYEPNMRKVLEHYLGRGGMFVDLGANEGYFSVLASRQVGPVGEVIAVEPQTRLQRLIQQNLSANCCYNVRLIQCAVSDITGKLRLSLAPSTNNGASSLFKMTKYPLPTEEVRSLRLVDLLDQAGVDSCDLMKVDIEGAEYEAFMAATDLLKQGRIRNIALEIHSSILAKRGLAGEDLHKHMLASGYVLSKEFGFSVYSFVNSQKPTEQ